MTERRATRRYELSLPVSAHPSVGAVSAQHKGTTRNVSTRGVYLLLDRVINPNFDFDLTMVLPTESSGGSSVFVRAVGKVVRVETWSREGNPGAGVAAMIRRYEIVRNDPTTLPFPNRKP
jgi:hypothetical protein